MEKMIRRPKYAIYDKKSEPDSFYLNNLRVDGAWHNHFSGLTMEQESRCVPLFISWFRRTYPKHFKKIKPYSYPAQNITIKE